MTSKYTAEDFAAALEGREKPKLSDFDFSLETSGVTESASALAGYDFSMEDKPDPFKVAADARLLEAMGESVPRDADALWMERSEVNMAAASYGEALVRSSTATATTDTATERAERVRDKFMAENRRKYPTEAALLEATATHLTGLAAAHRRPAAERKTPTNGATRTSVSESTGPKGPGPSPEMTRLYRAMDAYRDSITRGSGREAFRDAAERTNRERRTFMAENRRKYPTEAALQAATAEHFANLAIDKN